MTRRTVDATDGDSPQTARSASMGVSRTRVRDVSWGRLGRRSDCGVGRGRSARRCSPRRFTPGRRGSKSRADACQPSDQTGVRRAVGRVPGSNDVRRLRSDGDQPRVRAAGSQPRSEATPRPANWWRHDRPYVVAGEPRQASRGEIQHLIALARGHSSARGRDRGQAHPRCEPRSQPVLDRGPRGESAVV